MRAQHLHCMKKTGIWDFLRKVHPDAECGKTINESLLDRRWAEVFGECSNAVRDCRLRGATGVLSLLSTVHFFTCDA